MDALSALAERNEVTLMWVPGHSGILGNEKADELARQGAAKPLLVQSRLLE
jgi:ribonuclease HI